MSTDTNASFALQLGTTALTLVLVLVLAWLMLRALKRWQLKTGVGQGAHPVQVVHSVALGPRERLVTVRWRGREYLLGVAAGGVQRIADMPVDAAVPAGPPVSTAAQAPAIEAIEPRF
jgi:flagellar biogenesis protein FliO